MAIAMTLGFAACSDDFDDASSPHSYGADEPVFINTNAGFKENISMEVPVTQLGEAKQINLGDYQHLFNDIFGMNVQQAIAAVKAGTLSFKAISASKGQWLPTPFNYGMGWKFDASNRPCETGEVATVAINEAKQTIDLIVSKSAPAGTELAINVGFAKRNPSLGTYDDYLRFEITTAITDPTIVMASFSLVQGDYAGYEFFFENNYDKQFLACLGLTAQEALNGLEDGSVKFALTDANGKPQLSDYTADAGDGYYGYWFNNDVKVCNWGAPGCLCFANAELNERAIFVGRYPGLDSGITFKLYLKMWLAADENKYIRFIFTCTTE